MGTFPKTAGALRGIAWWLAALTVAALAASALVYSVLQDSLPRRSGAVSLPALAAPVTVELDLHGVPRIRGARLTDVFTVQGFVHAQERFFQMDLARRNVAGELAEILGEDALALDRSRRVFQYRARAQALQETLPADHRRWLAAYAQGVNAGLADLARRPPEYWLLGTEPVPWTVADSLLVAYYFSITLSTNHTLEKPQGVMEATLPAEVYRFMTPSLSRFDRPIVVPSNPDLTGGYAPLPIPPPHAMDLRGVTAPEPSRAVIDPPLLGPASNHWVADRSRTLRADAILASDPHLRLRLPNVFYRCELYWPEGAARGVSIPGVPGVAVGATDHLAWGPTVSMADQSDWVVVEVLPTDSDRYLVPGGTESFHVETEAIRVKGRDASERLEIRHTRWGPVAEEDWLGRPLALRAAWLEPDGVNLGLLNLLFAQNVAEGVAVLQEWAGPSNNWMVADDAGAIAWVVNGPLPRRVGFDGSAPVSWAQEGIGWVGRRLPPALVAPADGTLFAANNRTLPAEAARELSRIWTRPFRAHRIGELLGAGDRFTEADFLQMQLDTRAQAYDWLRDLILEIIPESETVPALLEARAHAKDWNGHADPGQTGFRILNVYYQALLQRVLTPLLKPALAADPAFVFEWPLVDEPLRRILEDRPGHLLTSEHAGWDAFLRTVLLDALADVERSPARPGSGALWGEVNRLDVGHVFSDLPILGRRLRLPSDTLPGSTVSLRVATPSYGAVIRMVVSPAHPERGILQMPGGQSGHFLSPNFADLHGQWVAGSPTPFLAGPTVWRFALRP